MTPPTLKQLIEKATPGPWQARFIYRLFSSARRDIRMKLGAPQEQDWPNAQLIARCSPSVMLAVLSALDNGYCTINNALEAERTSEAPITEQCRVFIDARKEILTALNLLNGKAP